MGGAYKRLERLYPVPPRDRSAIVNLRADQCRWPIGDPASSSFRFCRASKERAGSYCHSHSLVSMPRMAGAAAGSRRVTGDSPFHCESTNAGG